MGSTSITTHWEGKQTHTSQLRVIMTLAFWDALNCDTNLVHTILHIITKLRLSPYTSLEETAGVRVPDRDEMPRALCTLQIDSHLWTFSCIASSVCVSTAGLFPQNRTKGQATQTKKISHYSQGPPTSPQKVIVSLKSDKRHWLKRYRDPFIGGHQRAAVLMITVSK